MRIYKEDNDRDRLYSFKTIKMPNIPVYDIVMLPFKIILYLCYGILGLFGVITLIIGYKKYKDTDDYEKTDNFEEHVKNVLKQKI